MNIMYEFKFDFKKEDKLAVVDFRSATKRLEQMILASEESSERNLERYSRDV